MVMHFVRIFWEPNQICFCSFLQSQYGKHLEVHVISPYFKGYLSQTKSKKGNLWIRRSVLSWNWQISWRATVPGQYLLGFFTLPAFRSSFQGALPPTVSLSFLLAGSFSPNIDGLASTAIWAHCWVGSDSSDLPTSPNFSASSILLSISCGIGGASTSGTGGPLLQGVPGVGHALLPSISLSLAFPSPPSLVWPLFLPYWKESQPIRSQSSFIRVMWHLFWNNQCIFSRIFAWS